MSAQRIMKRTYDTKHSYQANTGNHLYAHQLVMDRETWCLTTDTVQHEVGAHYRPVLYHDPQKHYPGESRQRWGATCYTASWIGNTKKRKIEAEKKHVGEREGSTRTRGWFYHLVKLPKLFNHWAVPLEGGHFMTRKTCHNDEAVYKKNHTGRIFLNLRLQWLRGRAKMPPGSSYPSTLPDSWHRGSAQPSRQWMIFFFFFGKTKHSSALFPGYKINLSFTLHLLPSPI